MNKPKYFKPSRGLVFRINYYNIENTILFCNTEFILTLMGSFCLFVFAGTNWENPVPGSGIKISTV